MEIEKYAMILDRAAKNANPVEQISLTAEFDEKTAYKIQFESIRNRVNRGEKIIGYKMGFTSRAKMEQMGVHDLIWGILTDEMEIQNEAKISLNKFIHPRAEPEICFLIGKDIKKEMSIDELKDSVSGVSAAIEIIDSRYQNFKFSLEDVIADNCSSSGFVLGQWTSSDNLLEDLKISLLINEEIVETGSTNAILENPWNSLQEASRIITSYGHVIKAGSIILAGAATPAKFLKVGDSVEVRIEGLIGCGFSVNS